MRNIFTWLIILGLLAGGAYVQMTSAKPINSREAIEKIILDHSSRTRVVMFGGRHETYRADNDFVAELLPKLREQGFKYLAVEFEKNPREDTFHRIIQDYAHGNLRKRDIRYMWIFREQIHCAGTFDLIDKANESNMKIVFYDADEYSYKYWHEREIISYRNLKELIFDRDPAAKVVIFCGALHINERPHEDIYAASWEGKQEKMKYLASYLEDDSRNRNFTVSLVGRHDSQLVAPHCDMVVDLDDNHYFYTRPLRATNQFHPPKNSHYGLQFGHEPSPPILRVQQIERIAAID